MSEQVPSQFDGVSVLCKANIYYDGKVLSHVVIFPDGTKKTLGLLYAGAYTFNTEAAERMEIVAGSCNVKLAGEDGPTTYGAGSAFDVPAHSAFDIEIESGITEYICSYFP